MANYRITVHNSISEERARTQTGIENGSCVACNDPLNRTIGFGGAHMAILRTIPRVALIIVFMPFLLFAIVLWAPIRKMIFA